jgi:hypothetical protein
MKRGIVEGNGYPMKAEKKILSNEPCRCGSGKKAKRCCGVNSDRKYFYSRLNHQQMSKMALEEENKVMKANLKAK